QWPRGAWGGRGGTRLAHSARRGDAREWGGGRESSVRFGSVELAAPMSPRGYGMFRIVDLRFISGAGCEHMNATETVEIPEWETRECGPHMRMPGRLGGSERAVGMQSEG